MEEKIVLFVTHKGGLTVFDTEDYGLRARLVIVLSEKGYRIVRIDGSESAIGVIGFISKDEVNNIINEQFNPDVIDIESTTDFP